MSVASSRATWLGVCARWLPPAVGLTSSRPLLLPIFQQVIGPEHLDTLTTRGNLATWTAVAGDAAGARDQFAALLPIRGPADVRMSTERTPGAAQPVIGWPSDPPPRAGQAAAVFGCGRGGCGSTY